MFSSFICILFSFFSLFRWTKKRCWRVSCCLQVRLRHCIDGTSPYSPYPTGFGPQFLCLLLWNYEFAGPRVSLGQAGILHICVYFLSCDLGCFWHTFFVVFLFFTKCNTQCLMHSSHICFYFLGVSLIHIFCCVCFLLRTILSFKCTLLIDFLIGVFWKPFFVLFFLLNAILIFCFKCTFLIYFHFLLIGVCLTLFTICNTLFTYLYYTFFWLGFPDTLFIYLLLFFI